MNIFFIVNINNYFLINIKIIYNLKYYNKKNLVRVSKTSHTRHNSEDVVVDSVNIKNLIWAFELSIINSREVACA